jgi:CheY-like chemotaxis protein
VHLMKGALTVQSEENKGSEFHFELALASEREQVEVKRAPVSFNALPPFPGIRVLVAEDNNVNSLLIKKYLTTWKIDPCMVENGEEAIKVLRVESFDLIIMDTRMPVMDGFETARYVREKLNLNTPILSLSATVLVEEVEKAIDSGMNDTLSKPFQPVMLHEKITTLLNFNKISADEEVVK